MKKFYFKEKFFKITDHYKVLDESNKEVYLVNQDFKLIGFSVEIKNLISKEKFKVNRKLFRFLPNYKIYFEDGSVMDIKAKFSPFIRKVDVNYRGHSLKLKGKIFDFNFDIYKDSKLIGMLDKKIISFTDQYVLTVMDEEYSDILVALTICVNNMKDMDDSINAASGD